MSGALVALALVGGPIAVNLIIGIVLWYIGALPDSVDRRKVRRSRS